MLETEQSVVNQTVIYVRETLASDATGHDWWHIQRVWQMAKHLAEHEPVNQFVVQLAALLHDIADWKFHQGDDKASADKAQQWLVSLGVATPLIQQVTSIINEVTYRGANVSQTVSSLESQIVQDADRLDALGAIGIGRAFAYGGHKGRAMYDPEIKPVFHESFEAYKNHNGTTINHFHEKLFLLKDRLHTKTAKQIAEKRHQFMEQYIETFLTEWHFNQTF